MAGVDLQSGVSNPRPQLIQEGTDTFEPGPERLFNGNGE